MVVPRPCVGKRMCLRTVFDADVVVYLVVVAFGTERRINITKINRLVTDKLPHHIKIIDVEDFVDLTGPMNQVATARGSELDENHAPLRPLAEKNRSAEGQKQDHADKGICGEKCRIHI